MRNKQKKKNTKRKEVAVIQNKQQMAPQIVVPSFISLLFIYAFFGRIAFNIGFAVFCGGLGGFFVGQTYLEKVDPKKNFKSLNFGIPAFLTFLAITFFILFIFDIRQSYRGRFDY